MKNNILSPTRARQNFFTLLDEVIKTGIPKFINRNGQKVKISVEKESKKSIFDKISPCEDLVVGNSDDLAEFKAWQWDSKKFDDL